MLTVFLAGATTSLNAALSQELDQRIDAILGNLRETDKSNNYSTEQFLTDLKSVSEKFEKDRSSTIDSSVSPLKREFIALAIELKKEENEKRLKELHDWYGGFAHDLPDELLEKFAEVSIRRSKRLGNNVTLDQIRINLSKGPKNYARIIPYRPPVVALKKEHSIAEYLTAWKFWLMAPDSKEKTFIGGRINTSLLKINDKSVIPLIAEAMKSEINKWQRQTSDSYPQKRLRLQQDTAKAYINLICSMPSEQSLEALLNINRYAIANDLNGEDYYKSISRHIARRLASRRAYADQLIDPKMKATIDRQGYNEKPEDIPLTDELWKKYKPLLEARIETKTDETSQADIELIKSALEIMPKG